ncbi:DNA-directed RNA polymerase II subunit rpb3 [Phytophthora nicotianae]|uniref:DNA-directed RNA polymerase II subunit rpb3 n=1 Tax=Phytophthora nicotianae TaxID=4792 RepID=A0A0W8CMT9_PHYNI|nr:DNA-directed RNA polymerase II subunit rpb3 [Phytophthora nicotianae]
MQSSATPSKARGVNYKPVEDKVLCEAWLSVSCNPINGIYQSGDDFYNKVKKAFDTELARLKSTVAERPVPSLNSQFQTISQAVSKFVACHEKDLRVCQSGRSPSDQERDAVALYESIPKNGSFKFLQCWHILRDSEKWGAWRTSNEKRQGSKRSASVRDRNSSSNASLNSSERSPPAETLRVQGESEEPRQGVTRAKLDRANQALYARQVKAAERAAENAEKRIKVAQEQLDLTLFTAQAAPNDPLAAEYLMLKKQAVLKRLRLEALSEPSGSSISLAAPMNTGEDVSGNGDAVATRSNAIAQCVVDQAHTDWQSHHLMQQVQLVASQTLQAAP